MNSASLFSPEYNNFSSKPLPADLTEFLANPFHYRVTEDFLSHIVVDDSESVLTHCIKIQNVEAVEVLLRCGVDPNHHNRKGVAPISAAAHKGNLTIMSLLIKCGAHVNAINQSGSTALIQASHFGHVEAVKLLLAHDANPDFANVKGTTALMRASQEGHVEISRALIQSAVDVNRRNHEGMNALMLASQRGHAEIVMLLIQAGAVKDEQTAQGSTALMLACKRGHEKCAEVLVCMGAEIYMRDRRFRTARDTALRRNHSGVLVWLDTQLQVAKIQEMQCRQRAEVIKELRRDYLEGRLQLSPVDAFVEQLVESVRFSLKPQSYRQDVRDKHISRLEDFLSSAPHLPFHARSPATVLDEIRAVVSGSYIAEKNSLFPLRNAAKAAHRVPDYADWQWSLLFYRCLGLPSGIFETIMEYLPYPRIWPWSLSQMPRRCKLAPSQAVLDTMIIMDEILRDAVLIAGPDQKNLLVQIARSPQLHDLLLGYHGMSATVLEKICTWSDVQSLLNRTCANEAEVSFKLLLAKQLHLAAIHLYRWFRQRNNSAKLFALSATVSSSTAPGQGKFAVHVTGSTNLPMGPTSCINSTATASAAATSMISGPISAQQLEALYHGYNSANHSYPNNGVVGVGGSSHHHNHQHHRGSVTGNNNMMVMVAGVLEPEEAELLEAADVTGQDVFDLDNDVVMMEPDTETEFHVGADGEDVLEDSDNDAANAAVNNNAPLAMPPAPPVVGHHHGQHHHHHHNSASNAGSLHFHH